MNSGSPAAFRELKVDHVRFYVDDMAAETHWLNQVFGLPIRAQADSAERGARSVAFGVGSTNLVLTQGHSADHPASVYVAEHGSGVADIALQTPDVSGVFREAVRRGAQAVAEPAFDDDVFTASIGGFADVVHTLVQQPASGGCQRVPGLPAGSGDAGEATDLFAIDHLAVCLRPGTLDSTVEFYEHVLGFDLVFTERIEVGAQAMNSKVVQSSSGGVTLTLIEPDTTRAPGQIDDFLKNHDGPGVQHIALTSPDIVSSVSNLNSRGANFLSTPDSYYRKLVQRLSLRRHSADSLRELNILVDEDHDGQLFQIFCASQHPRGTFFFEIIERMGARTFGSGNIKALYEAVELERSQEAGAS